jgi:hypothetical protein
MRVYRERGNFMGDVWEERPVQDGMGVMSQEITPFRTA